MGKEICLIEQLHLFSAGAHMGLLKIAVMVTAALCLMGLCSVQSNTDPFSWWLSSPGRCCYLQVFSPFAGGQY